MMDHHHSLFLLCAVQVAQVRQRPDVRVITVTRNNRDALVTEIAEAVTACLRAGNQPSIPAARQDEPLISTKEAQRHQPVVPRLQGSQWNSGRVGYAAAPAGPANHGSRGSTAKQPWQLQ